MSKSQNKIAKAIQSFLKSRDKQSALELILEQPQVYQNDRWWSHFKVGEVLPQLTYSDLQFEQLALAYLSQDSFDFTKNLPLLRYFLGESRRRVERLQSISLEAIVKFEFLLEQEEYNQELLSKIGLKLEEYSWIDLLSLLSIWGDLNYSQTVSENQNPKAPFPLLFLNAMSKAIQCRLKKDQKPKWTIENLPRLREKFLSTLNRAQNPKYWQQFSCCMNEILAYLQWVETKECILYLGYQLFRDKEGCVHILPQSPKDEMHWDKIYDQLKFTANYYYNVGMEMLSPEQRGFPGLVEPFNPAFQLKWKAYGIPEEVKIRRERISTSKAILFLTGLGAFHRSRYAESLINRVQEIHPSNIQEQRHLEIINEATYDKHLWPKPIMGGLNIATTAHLVDRVSGKVSFDVNVDANETRDAIDFLALDVKYWKPEWEFSLFEFPFLKFGEVIFWFTMPITLTDPAIMFKNRIHAHAVKLRKKGNGKLQKQISDQFETNIGKLFKEAGFKFLTNVDLASINKKYNGRVTEIDVLAYKDNEILIIQAKNTYSRLGVIEIETYRSTLEKAGNQVDIATEWLTDKDNLNLFLKKFNLPDKLKKPNLLGLVVSSTPEWNYEYFGKGKHLKTSFTELEIILFQTKSYLIDWELKALEFDLGSTDKVRKIMFNSTGDDFTKLRAAQLRQKEKLDIFFSEKCDLWKGEEPSLSGILGAVKDDWVWNGVIAENIQSFPSKEASPEAKKAFLLFSKGRTLFKEFKFKEAIPFFQEARKLDSSDPEYWQWEIDAIADLGGLEEAIESYGQFLSKFPEYALGYFNRGGTKHQFGQKKEALRDYETAIKLNPTNDKAYLRIIELKSELEGYELQKADFVRLQLIEIEDLFFAYRHLFRKFFHNDRQLNLYKMTLEEITEQGRFYANFRNYDKSLKCWNHILERNPQNIYALDFRGRIKINKKMYPAAILDFQKIIKLDQNHAESWTQIGICLIELKQFKKAMESCEEALSIAPDNIRANYHRGLALVAQEKYDTAINNFEICIEDAELGGIACYYLGKIQEVAGNIEKAQYWYQEAVIRRFDDAINDWVSVKQRSSDLKFQ